MAVSSPVFADKHVAPTPPGDWISSTPSRAVSKDPRSVRHAPRSVHRGLWRGVADLRGRAD
eukprot:807974-Pyramimonas_sp.AAC.1